jgi:hypothetical protein
VCVMALGPKNAPTKTKNPPAKASGGGSAAISDLRRYYKISCAPKQDTAVLAVRFRRQQQAAFVG